MIHIVVYTTCIHGEAILENQEERKMDMDPCTGSIDSRGRTHCYSSSRRLLVRWQRFMSSEPG